MQQLIKKDSRQIPKDVKTTSNKNYYDRIYGYLQSISQWDGDMEHFRYVPRKGFSFAKMSRDLDMDRGTVTKYFKAMLDTPENVAKDNPILIQEKFDRYELIRLQKELAMLVPQDTLIILISALNHRAISTYVYLYNRYFASNCKPFIFTYKEVRHALGMNGSNEDYNNKIIEGILTVLSKLGLLDWVPIDTKSGDDDYQTMFRMLFMSNVVPKDKDIELADEKQRKLYHTLSHR